VAEPVLQFVSRYLAREISLKAGLGDLPVVRVQQSFPRGEVVLHFLVFVAEHTLPAGREIDFVGREIPIPHAVAAALNHQGQPFLAEGGDCRRRRLDRKELIANGFFENDR